MRRLKILFVLLSITLTSFHESHALKKLFRVRPGMEDKTEILTIVAQDSTRGLYELCTAPGVATISTCAAILLPPALKSGSYRTAQFLYSCIDFEYLPDKYQKDLLHQILARAKDNRAYYQCIALWTKKLGGGLSIKNSNGEYALDIAFRKDLRKIAVQLIGADRRTTAFSKRNKGYNLLHYATEYGIHDIIKYLVNTYRHINNSGDSYGWTALHYASAKGDFDTCRFLLALGCRADIQNSDKKTALELWPPNHKQQQCTNLAGMIRTKMYTSDGCYYYKNLLKFATNRNSTLADIKIKF